jgi:hypothetical protein
VTNENVNDNRMFRPLFKSLLERFKVEAVMADKAYCYARNYTLVEAHGAKPFIDIADKPHMRGTSEAFTRAQWLRKDPEMREKIWDPNYCLRQIVECFNSMFQRNRSQKIRAKSEEARETEILAMCVVQNLCQLSMIWKRLNITIPFADERAMRALRGEPIGPIGGDDADEESAA